MLEPIFKTLHNPERKRSSTKAMHKQSESRKLIKRTAIESSKSEDSRSDDKEKIECDEQENAKFEEDELRCLMTQMKPGREVREEGQKGLETGHLQMSSM
jgi:hypothetical protein